VYARGVVAGKGAQQHKEEHGGGEDVAALRRRDEAHHGKGEDEEGHDEQLHARADEDGKEGGQGVGGAEDVAVHQLPAALLPRLLELGGVVARNVGAQRAQHDHGHERREEEHNEA
jgi:hypothetical protein